MCSQCERNGPLRTKEGRYGTDSNHGCLPFTVGTDSEKWARAWNSPLRKRRRCPLCYPWSQRSECWKAWAQNLPVWALPPDVRHPLPKPQWVPGPGQPASRGGVSRSAWPISAVGTLPPDCPAAANSRLLPSLLSKHIFSWDFLGVFPLFSLISFFFVSFAFISSEILCGVLHDYFCCTTRKAELRVLFLLWGTSVFDRNHWTIFRFYCSFLIWVCLISFFFSVVN